MDKITSNDTPVPLLGADWFDPLEAGVRQRIRSFIEAMLESELGRLRGIATVIVTAGSSARSG